MNREDDDDDVSLYEQLCASERKGVGRGDRRTVARRAGGSNNCGPGLATPIAPAGRNRGRRVQSGTKQHDKLVLDFKRIIIFNSRNVECVCLLLQYLLQSWSGFLHLRTLGRRGVDSSTYGPWGAVEGQ